MSASVVSFPAPPRRSIPLARRRRLSVRIVASANCREPYGRSRPFSICEDDLPELVARVEQLEARR